VRLTSNLRLFIVPNKNQLRSQRAKDKGKNRQIARVVKSMLNSSYEIKAYDTAISSTIDNTGSFTDLLVPSSGTLNYQRIGNSVSLKKLIVRCNFTVADSSNILRMVLLRWHPSSTSDVPQVAELLNSTSNPLAMYIIQKPSRFKVIYDQIITVDTYNPIKSLDFELDLNGKVSFDTGVTTGSEHLYLFLQSDSGAASHPLFNYYGSVLYYDD